MSTIQSISTHLLTDGLPQLLVEVTDSEGNRGIGECWWGIPNRADPGRGARPIAAAVDDLAAPIYLGKDPERIQQLWLECRDFAYRYGDGGLVPMAIAGIDIALWDLMARRMGVSVLTLLGGPVRDRVAAYASLPPLRDPDLLESETRRAIAHGFKAIKLHELNTEAVSLVRSVGGPDLGIMVDVNGHFEVTDAIRLGNDLARYDVIWFEEPVQPMRDVHAIAEVAQATPVDLAAGENEYSLADFRRLIDSGAIRYLQPEITKIGGITPAIKIGALAEAGNVALCPHNFRSGPSLLASIHWGFASAATTWFEVPWIPENWRFASAAPLPDLVEGCLLPPRVEGLGFDLST